MRITTFEGHKVKRGNSYYVLIPLESANSLEENKEYCFSVEED